MSAPIDWRRIGKRQRAILRILDNLLGDNKMPDWHVAVELRKAGHKGHGVAWVWASLRPLIRRELVRSTLRGGVGLTRAGRDYAELNDAGGDDE